MRLFIAEKPSVAKAIAGELGVTGKSDGFIRCGGDTITWCFGHMLEQAEPDEYLADDVPVNPTTGRKLWRAEDLPVIPVTWIMRPRPDAKPQLAVIGKLLGEASEVVNAGDPDREETTTGTWKSLRASTPVAARPRKPRGPSAARYCCRSSRRAKRPTRRS